jgi:hypothetical protein
MNRFYYPAYRIVVPKFIRNIILKVGLRKSILDHFAGLPEEEINDEQNDVIKFIRKNGIKIFPYDFHNHYSENSIEVFFDLQNHMRYVFHEGKRLYFKKKWGISRIKRAYCDLVREQDLASPHRYLSDSFQIMGSDVIADIGAADGNFSLSVIENVKRVYLFEHDKEWIEALQATFEPWKDKVKIINRYVAGHNDEKNIRFDTFFEENGDVNFLKIDVDGAESHVLESCASLFQIIAHLKIVLCTYHKNNDEMEFTSKLRDHGFKVIPSPGYMIFYYDKLIAPPYLRRGLIRATKGGSGYI